MCTPRSGCRTARRSSETSPRWRRTRVSGTSLPRRSSCVQAVPDARFLIVGEGELKDALERQIKHLALERHVLLTGFRPDALA